LAYVIYVWDLLRVARQKKLVKRQALIKTVLLLVAPFIPFTMFTIFTAVYGNQPVKVEGKTIPGSNLAVPTAFYCDISNGDENSPGSGLFQAVYGFNAAISLITLGFDGAILSELYRNRNSIKAVSRRRLVTPVFIRLVAFTIYRIVSLALTFSIFVDPGQVFLINPSHNGAIAIFQATLPLVAFLVLGTQPDVVQAVCCWNRRKASPHSSSDLALKSQNSDNS